MTPFQRASPLWASVILASVARIAASRERPHLWSPLTRQERIEDLNPSLNFKRPTKKSTRAGSHLSGHLGMAHSSVVPAHFSLDAPYYLDTALQVCRSHAGDSVSMPTLFEHADSGLTRPSSRGLERCCKAHFGKRAASCLKRSAEAASNNHRSVGSRRLAKSSKSKSDKAGKRNPEHLRYREAHDGHGPNWHAASSSKVVGPKSAKSVKSEHSTSHHSASKHSESHHSASQHGGGSMRKGWQAGGWHGGGLHRTPRPTPRPTPQPTRFSSRRPTSRPTSGPAADEIEITLGGHFLATDLPDDADTDSLAGVFERTLLAVLDDGFACDVDSIGGAPVGSDGGFEGRGSRRESQATESSSEVLFRLRTVQPCPGCTGAEAVVKGARTFDAVFETLEKKATAGQLTMNFCVYAEVEGVVKEPCSVTISAVVGSSLDVEWLNARSASPMTLRPATQWPPTPFPTIEAPSSAAPTMAPTGAVTIEVAISYELSNDCDEFTATNIADELNNSLKEGLIAATTVVTIETLNATFPRAVDGKPTQRKKASGARKRTGSSKEVVRVQNRRGLVRLKAPAPQIAIEDAKRRSLAYYTARYPVAITDILDTDVDCPSGQHCVEVVSSITVVVESGEDPDTVREVIELGIERSVEDGSFAAAIPADTVLICPERTYSPTLGPVGLPISVPMTAGPTHGLSAGSLLPTRTTAGAPTGGPTLSQTTQSPTTAALNGIPTASPELTTPGPTASNQTEGPTVAPVATRAAPSTMPTPLPSMFPVAVPTTPVPTHSSAITSTPTQKSSTITTAASPAPSSFVRGNTTSPNTLPKDLPTPSPTSTSTLPTSIPVSNTTATPVSRPISNSTNSPSSDLSNYSTLPTRLPSASSALTQLPNSSRLPTSSPISNTTTTPSPSPISSSITAPSSNSSSISPTSSPSISSTLTVVPTPSPLALVTDAPSSAPSISPTSLVTPSPTASPMSSILDVEVKFGITSNCSVTATDVLNGNNGITVKEGLITAMETLVVDILSTTHNAISTRQRAPGKGTRIRVDNLPQGTGEPRRLIIHSSGEQLRRFRLSPWRRQHVASVNHKQDRSLVHYSPHNPIVITNVTDEECAEPMVTCMSVIAMVHLTLEEGDNATEIRNVVLAGFELAKESNALIDVSDGCT